MSVRRMLLFGSGAAGFGLGIALGAYLAAEAWTPGTVGYPLLLATPGLALMAKATGTLMGRHLVAVTALALALLGLDVTDSARGSVVVAGYCVLVLGAGFVVGALAWGRLLPRSG